MTDKKIVKSLDNGNQIIEDKEFLKDIDELEKYRELGSVEEVKKMMKEEDVLKFYYCESEDEYYIGKRIDTMYYAKYSKTGFTWCMSRYLPWGEHVVEPNTLWKEHTYPSEPKEIPFFKWLQGFVKKYCLGTVEECREAREKQKEKKSIEYKNKTDALVDKLRKYAAEYNLPPFGREIEGTAELLLEAAETIEILTIEFEEHMRYRAIGTVEECQQARERQKAKKPTLYGDFEDGKLICQNCEEDLMDLAKCGFSCCPYCGQKLDWSE